VAAHRFEPDDLHASQKRRGGRVHQRSGHQIDGVVLFDQQRRGDDRRRQRAMQQRRRPRSVELHEQQAVGRVQARQAVARTVEPAPERVGPP